MVTPDIHTLPLHAARARAVSKKDIVFGNKNVLQALRAVSMLDVGDLLNGMRRE